MNHWLLKTEPSEYAFDDLSREKTCVWDGVTNALALSHLRTMRNNDRAIIYHTGREKQAVGLATIVGEPYADPQSEDDRHVVVDLKAGRRLANPVTLATLKGEAEFAGSDLLRLGRLSVVPLSKGQFEGIERLAATPAAV